MTWTKGTRVARQAIIALTIAISLPLCAARAQPPPGGWHGGWGGPFVGGLALGLGLGLVPYYVAPPPAYYYPPPYYYGPPAGYYGGPPDDAVAYCMQRFKSYDPGSGTYLGYDGYRHPCP